MMFGRTRFTPPNIGDNVQPDSIGHCQRIIFRSDYQHDLPPVRVFGNTLNQVWTNILDDALDAMRGKGTIAIRTRREDDAAVVEIEDNGDGNASEGLASIFEPFFRTKPQGRGTGLGLDPAGRIVAEEHGGTIGVTSEPGRTTFRVALPPDGRPHASDEGNGPASRSDGIDTASESTSTTRPQSPGERS